MSTGESVPSLGLSLCLLQTDISHMTFCRLGLAGIYLQDQYRTCDGSAT